MKWTKCPQLVLTTRFCGGNMQFTFGITTTGDVDDRINQIIDSIELNNIPEDSYEIIIAGSSKVNRKNTIILNQIFEPGYITKKKNAIAEHAKYNNVVLSHDYISFNHDWYQNMVIFGENWDVCMNRILNTDGKRFRDWFRVSDGNPEDILTKHHSQVHFSLSFVNYNDNSYVNNTYVGGTYFIVKKDFILNYPLDNNRRWGEGEDVEWGYRINKFWHYKINPLSIVKIIKHKNHYPPSPE